MTGGMVVEINGSRMGVLLILNNNIWVQNTNEYTIKGEFYGNN